MEVQFLTFVKLGMGMRSLEGAVKESGRRKQKKLFLSKIRKPMVLDAEEYLGFTSESIGVSGEYRQRFRHNQFDLRELQDRMMGNSARHTYFLSL